MAIGEDKVQLIKHESSALGGKDSDRGPFDSPEPLNAKEDAIEVAGVYLNDETDRDDLVKLYRDLGNMFFKDNVVPTSISLSQLASNSLVAKEPTGFSDPSAITVTYDSVARTITLTGTVEGYWRGDKVAALVNGWTSPAHPLAPTQPQFLQYNGTAFIWTTTVWEFSAIPIAFVSFNSSGDLLFALRECHGVMPWQVHENIHETLGTYRSSGGYVSGFVLNSTTPADRRPTITETLIHDEDVPSVLAEHTTKNNYSVMQLTGTNGIPTITTGSDEFILFSGGAQWNEFTGGSWQLTTLSNNEYMSMWLMAIPASADSGSQDTRFIWVTGQSASSGGFFSSGLTEQQNLSPYDLDLGEFENLSPEFIFIEQVIIQETGVNDWQVIEQRRLTGTRVQNVSGSSGGVTDHGALTGLEDYDHPQYYKRPEHLITVSKVGTLTAGDFSTIQSAIDSITDASSTNLYTVLVYPGAYSENVVLKDGVNLRGAGTSADVIISASTGSALTYGAGSSTVKDISILVNAVTTGVKAISCALGGTGYIDSSVIIYNAIGTYGTVVDVQAGLIRANDLTVSYTNSVSGGGDHVGINLGANGAFTATNSRMHITVDSNDNVYGFKSGSNLVGEAVIDSIQMGITVTASDYSGNTYGIIHTGTAPLFHFTTSHVNIQCTGGGTITGTATHMNVSTGSSTVRGTANAIHVTGFAKNYFANIGTGCTFISHYDDANASDGAIGLGDLYRVGSTENGELRVSDSLKVGSVLDGNYIDIESDGTITLHGNARVTKHVHIDAKRFGRGTGGLGAIANTMCSTLVDSENQWCKVDIKVPDDIDLTVSPQLMINMFPRSDRTVGSQVVLNVTDLRYLVAGQAVDKTPDEIDLKNTIVLNDSKRYGAMSLYTLDASKMAGGAGLSCRIIRMTDDVNDDRNGDLCIPMVTLVYTSASLG